MTPASVNRIHPTAIIHPAAHIGRGVEIGAYTLVGEHVEIGDNTHVGPHVVLTGHTRIGCDNRIFQFCSLGEVPQDKKYADEPTRLEIGDRNVIREFCTFNRGTAQDVGVLIDQSDDTEGVAERVLNTFENGFEQRNLIEITL